jgi:hypothetical protein
MNSGKCNYSVTVPSFAKAKDLRGMHWQSLVFYSFLYGYTKKKQTNGKWINIPSKLFKKLYGKHYRWHVSTLLPNQLGWIEENPKYKNDTNGFTKSFRLSDRTYDKKHRKFPILLQKRIYEKFVKTSKDKSDLSTEYAQLLKSRHDTLFISKSRSVASKALKTRLDLKIANITLGENKRAYSTIISSRKTPRKDVMYGDRGWLVNVDVSGMVQQILNRKTKNEKWNDWINKDFASCLQKSLGLKANRNSVKKQFMIAISDGEQTENSSKILQFLKKEFPEIMDHVDGLKNFGTIQMVTQQVEADLIRSFIMKHQSLNVLPAHDGLFCGEMDAEWVQAALERFLHEQGMAGATKMTYYNPKSRPLTLEEILSQIP